MSGLQDVAAIIGIAEASFRSISSLYDFLKSLKDIPKEVSFLEQETRVLQKCLAGLDILKTADEQTRATVKHIGLPQAVENCALACSDLQKSLGKWAGSPTLNLRSKIQYRWHRKAIESVRTAIEAAKQTAILSIQITQLSIQLRHQMSDEGILSGAVLEPLPDSHQAAQDSLTPARTPATMNSSARRHDPTANPPVERTQQAAPVERTQQAAPVERNQALQYKVWQKMEGVTAGRGSEDNRIGMSEELARFLAEKAASMGLQDLGAVKLDEEVKRTDVGMHGHRC